MEELGKSVRTKLKLLKFTTSQFSKTIKGINATSLERHRKTLETKIDEIHDLKVRVLELKIESGEVVESIEAWSTDLESEVSDYEQAIVECETKITELQSAEKQKAENDAAKIIEKKFEKEIEFEKRKIEEKLKSKEGNRGKWKLGIVENLIVGRDGTVRGAKLRVSTGHLERPIQHLYPLELSCDSPTQPPAQANLNPGATLFRSMKRRCSGGQTMSPGNCRRRLLIVRIKTSELVNTHDTEHLFPKTNGGRVSKLYC